MNTAAKKKSIPRSKATPNNDAFFITIEGGEGAGKSSQIELLKKKFIQLGHKVLITREPGGTAGAEAVRHVLLSGAAENLGPDMEAILFSAARSDHVDNVIKPALKKKQIVICDRFFDSTRVYQGVTGNVSMALLKSLEKIACGSIWPDLTLVLDLDPELGMERASKRRGKSDEPDRYEKESIALQRERRDGFLDIANKEPDRCAVIDASGTIDAVSKRIWSQVNKRLEIEDKHSKLAKTKTVKKLSHKALTSKKSGTIKKSASKKLDTKQPANKR